MNIESFALLVLLFVKHFVFDFMTQVPYYYLNKGKYMHPGGIMHATEHALGTSVVVFGMTGNIHLMTVTGIVDFVIHYHVDWAKTYIEHDMRLSNNDPQYWLLFGLDQMVHSLTYVFIVFWVYK